MRGQDADRITLRGTLRQSVAGDLLAGHAVQEERGGPRWQFRGEPRRGVEQSADRVEIPVRSRPRRSARGARGLPRLGQAAGIPHRPQHLVRVAVLRRLAGEPQQAGDPARGVGRVALQQRQLARISQYRGQRLLRRVLERGMRRGAQAAPEPAQAQGVGPAKRPSQQFRRRVLIQGAGAQRAAQQEEQRPDPRFGFERQLITCDGHGHPGGGQRPAQQWHLADHGPDQHRH